MKTGSPCAGLATAVLTVAAALTAGTRAQQPADSVWDGVYTEEQATRGQAVYVETCANCHGPALEGADMTPALTGATFSSNWNDLSLGDLFERIRISMPMDRPGTLPRQQNADVIAYMLKANRWPAGAVELPRELAVLKQIKIEAVEPAR
jgi:mono/diheme cytochrome c family protein